jgi:hypothetical protein
VRERCYTYKPSAIRVIQEIFLGTFCEPLT